MQVFDLERLYMAKEKETDKQLKEVIREASKSNEKEAMQGIKNFTLSKRVFDLFNAGIEKRKREIGKTPQEICLDKIPNYRGLLAALAPMFQNRLSPKQIYLNPLMRHAINSVSDEGVFEAKDKQEVNGIEFYSTPMTAPNTLYVLPDFTYVGVEAVKQFGLLNIKEIKYLENYADFPESVEEDCLLRLVNIKAPYKITVPQRALDDCFGIDPAFFE